MRRWLLQSGSIAVVLMFFAAGVVCAPNLISYQGVLTDSADRPISGPLEMTFSLYNAATGGSALWSETETVTLENGFYDVVLGDDVSLMLPFDQRYYLGVTVSGDTEMLPRQLLPQGAVSLRAERAEGLIDNAVSAAKLQTESVDPKQVNAGCNAGEILRMTASGWACGQAPQ